MPLPSVPLGFNASRKPLGFRENRLGRIIHRKPLGQFTPSQLFATQFSSASAPGVSQSVTPCLGQQIQAKLFTHPLIAASGIGTTLRQDASSSQDATRQFPWSWKFVSFDADNSESLAPIQANSSIPEDVFDSSVLSPKEMGPSAEGDQDPSSQRPDLQRPDIRLSRDSVTELPDNIARERPNQNRIQPELSIETRSPDTLSLSQDAEEEPGRSPTVDSPSTTDNLDIPSDIQPAAVDTPPEQPQRGEGRSPDPQPQSTSPQTDETLTPSLAQSRPAPIQTESVSPLPSLLSLNQQPGTTPELPSILPFSLNQEIVTGFDQPGILPPSEPIQNRVQRQDTEAKLVTEPEVDGIYPAFDVTPPAPLAQHPNLQSAPFSLADSTEGMETGVKSVGRVSDTTNTDTSLIPGIASLQDISNIQRRETPSIEGTIDSSPNTIPITDAFLNSVEPYSIQPSSLETQSLQAVETPFVAPFSVESPSIQAEFLSFSNPVDAVQTQMPLASDLETMAIAPLPPTSSDFQITEPAISSDVPTLQSLITPVDEVQAIQDGSQFTDAVQAQSLDADASHDLSAHPLMQPMSLKETELPANQQNLEPSIQPSPALPQASPNIRSIDQVGDLEAPEAERSPTTPPSQRSIRGKFTPLMPPLRHPLGAWDTVQDVIRRAIATPQEATESRPSDLQRQRIIPSESGHPSVPVPSESTVPETWSSIEDLITATTPPVQREPWEDQFPLLSPTPMQRQQDSQADESEPIQSFQKGKDPAEMVMARVNPVAIEPPTLSGDDVVQTPTRPITLKNPLSQADTPNAEKTTNQNFDDETLEQLAQSLYRHVRDRLVLAQDRCGSLTYPSSWLNVTSQRSRAKKQTDKMSKQSTSHQSEYPTSIEVDELIYNTYLNLSQRLSNDRERHGFR